MIITDIIKAYITDGEYVLPNGCDINTVCAVSERHDLAHLISGALEKQGVLPKGELGASLKKQKLLAIMRREQQDYELTRITSIFQNEEIPYILLKGAVMKNLYPQAWMRTSCDIDILIKTEHKSRATERLRSAGYNQESDGERDISFISKSGVNAEIHFSLLCDNEALNKILINAWDYTISVDKNEYAFTQEFFVFYHIAHMLAHFTEGGCGIRPFIDLWLYNKAHNVDASLLSQLLRQCGAFDFYNGVISLCEVWFEGRAHDRLTKLMEQYIVSGGVYGSRENLGGLGKHKKGGYAKYLLNRIFMPREKLRLVYPKIDKYPILIPYYWVKRWFTLLNKSKFKAAKSELRGKSKSNDCGELLTMLGL
ncbi:MAG: nucleotidyltransferase family protein [Clostridia bacterium]|nr:nucleotidyltransferase family protein [Clostridia bacterium]